MKKKCQDPKPFKYAPEVCDSCGGMLADHTQELVQTDDFVKAMWKVLLEIGGIWNLYGGDFEYAHASGTDRFFYQGGKRVGGNEMWLIQRHMEKCKIDWRHTEAPRMSDYLSVFNGTFTENGCTTGLVGRFTCKCGEYRYKEIGTKEITLSQLIWKVVHADDGCDSSAR